MILLMGIAGSGKGTQGKMLSDRHSYHLVSMGDVLRMHVTGEQRKKMLAGGLLDDQEIIKIIDKVLISIDNHGEVLLDGFPRTIPQAEWLLSQVKAGRFQIQTAYHLKASREAVKKRLMSRGRIDDVEDAIEARFNEYEHSTHPLLVWLQNNGVNVVNIDAERPVEDINQDLVNHINAHK